MPELPEVETVARGLRHLEGHRLLALELFDQKVWFESEADPDHLAGRILNEVSRRGKYILLRFEQGLTLVQHLRMTGKMLVAGSQSVPAEVERSVGKRHGKGLQIRCRFLFQEKNINAEKGRVELWFFDTRRFGTLTLVGNENEFFKKKKIAPDPVHAPVAARQWFLEKIAVAAKPAKAALLDQGIVAGVGNIYADEALFKVGVHPITPTKCIPDPVALWDAILALLHYSIQRGGTTIRDYVNAAGEAGTFANELLVYDRKEMPCKKCGTAIQRITLGGRSTHFCPVCQPQISGKKRPIQGGSRRGHSPSKRISAKLKARSRSNRKSPK
jgi:formamidopyrimidine-DNA glycosylase